MSQKENTKAKRSLSANTVPTKKNAGKDQTIEHEKLLKQCLLRLSSEGFLVWKNNTGAIKTQNRYQTYGLKGSPDIIGCSPIGIFCGFEIKTGNAVQNKHQKNFEHAVDCRNGFYMVIRSIKELEDWISV